MNFISTNAWILHKKPSGENSYYVTFFTRENGIVRSLFRGGQNVKKRSLLQQFNPLWVDFNVKNDNYYVNKIELTAPSLIFSGKNLFASLYLNELLYHSLHPLDENWQLYDIYVNTLNLLQLAFDNKSIEILLRKFEKKLLSSIGYGLSLSNNAKTGLPIQDNHYYKFVPKVGMIPNEKGILASHLQAIANDQLDDLEVLKSAKKIMRAAINDFLNGIEIKSRSLYSSSR